MIDKENLIKYLSESAHDCLEFGACEITKFCNILIKEIQEGKLDTNNDNCTWTKDEDPGGVEYYETSCKDAFLFAEGDCKDNRYNFCPKCGKHIKEAKDD